MRKRKHHPKLVALAKTIGAIRKDGKIDWYAVAEYLAKAGDPDSPTYESPTKKPGKPAVDWSWLVDDVHRLMQDQDCSIEEACEALANGAHPHRVMGVMDDGRKIPLRVAGSRRWKGMKAATLYQRYQEAMRPWRTFQRRGLDRARRISRINGWRRRQGKPKLSIG